MYLSKDILHGAFTRIAQIAPDEGKAGLERISAVSRFFACAMLLNRDNIQSLNLAPNEPDRNEFIGAVGRVISLGPDWLYTPDFRHREAKKDYAVGNNFLTAQVKRSQYRSEDYPSRPAPLLRLDDQTAALHPNAAQNLHDKYGWQNIGAAFGVWLCRDDNFETDLDVNNIAQKINQNNRARFGAAIADLTKVSDIDMQGFADGGKQVLTDQAADTSDFGKEVNDSSNVQGVEIPSIQQLGVNRLFYGAPATGKSHKVDGLVGTRNVTRTVFHPDTQNSDFFGSLKPRMNGDRIEYAFSPGPFSLALRAAFLSPGEHHFLVIEELNRASAAAVFGELFQLLDREQETGESSYHITFPTPESKLWFNENDLLTLDQLSIPGNLTIYATMNSADQGVFPLDTAFRRRWEQEYLPLYGPYAPDGNVSLIHSSEGEMSIPWDKFVRGLNGFLVEEFDAAEDRLLGQWFVRTNELGGDVPEKILLYLWDDLLRHEDRFVLFNKSAGRTYGELNDTRLNKGVVFSDRFLAVFDDYLDDAGH